MTNEEVTTVVLAKLDDVVKVKLMVYIKQAYFNSVNLKVVYLTVVLKD